MAQGASLGSEVLAALSSKTSASSAGAGASAREGAIAAAVAERASQASSRPAVGARFTVKRKAPEQETEGKAEDTKRSCVASGSSSTGAAVPAEAGSASSGAVSGGLGLGSYESDSS